MIPSPESPSQPILTPIIRAENAERALEAALLQYQKSQNPNAPRLLTGRPQVAANSLRHGLSGQSVYLTSTQLLAYLTIGRDLIDELAPTTIGETIHAQRIVDTEWRLNTAGALSTLCHTSAVILESQALYAANPHLANYHPDSAAIQNLEAHAQAGAVRRQCEGPNTMEKLGRQETRLFRSLRAMRQDYREMKAESGGLGERWNPEESRCYRWYSELAELAGALVAAREEISANTTSETTLADMQGRPLTDPQSAISEDPNLLCKNALKIVNPFSEEAAETLNKAHTAGLLTVLEETLFVLPKVA